MRVSEIFYSLQGEGMLAGTPSVLLRVAGCPLRCRWCDTRYAWDESAGVEMSVDAVIREVTRFDCMHAVITGGEPMISADIGALSRRLKALGKHVTIETAGIVFMSDVQCDLMSISPKLGNSIVGGRSSGQPRLDVAVLSELIANYEYQMKFVIDKRSDIEEVGELIERLAVLDRGKVMLMPQATTRAEYLAKAPLVAELCKESGYAFCQRLHLMLWDNVGGA